MSTEHPCGRELAIQQLPTASGFSQKDTGFGEKKFRSNESVCVWRTHVHCACIYGYFHRCVKHTSKCRRPLAAKSKVALALRQSPHKITPRFNAIFFSLYFKIHFKTLIWWINSVWYLIHGDRKLEQLLPGTRGRKGWGVHFYLFHLETLHVHEKVLEMDDGGGCPVMWTYLMCHWTVPF